MAHEITRFSFPTTIVFGTGAIDNLAEYLNEVNIKKPLLVTDPGLRKTETYKKVENVLKSSGTQFAVFSEVNPNPLDEDTHKAAAIYKENKCDGVIGLGGGSALDAAKVVPVLIAHGEPINRYDVMQGGGKLIKGPIPSMISIPTTAGTGSEVGRCSVLTSPREGKKFFVCSPHLMPKIAVLDPELTVSLPPALTAATGMDAFTHNIESLTAPVFHPMCDGIALIGIEYCAKYLKTAVCKPNDLEARGYMLLAAMMGAVAFQKDLGAVHSMAHPLSTLCNIQHGLANAICLVPVMKYNMEVAARQYKKVANCFGIGTSNLTVIEAAEKTIEAVVKLNESIGIPKSLKEAGVKENQLEELAKKAFNDPCHLTNARPCTKEDLLNLYREAYKGE